MFVCLIWFFIFVDQFRIHSNSNALRQNQIGRQRHHHQRQLLTDILVLLVSDHFCSRFQIGHQLRVWWLVWLCAKDLFDRFDHNKTERWSLFLVATRRFQFATRNLKCFFFCFWPPPALLPYKQTDNQSQLPTNFILAKIKTLHKTQAKPFVTYRSNVTWLNWFRFFVDLQLKLGCCFLSVYFLV